MIYVNGNWIDQASIIGISYLNKKGKPIDGLFAFYYTIYTQFYPIEIKTDDVHGYRISEEIKKDLAKFEEEYNKLKLAIATCQYNDYVTYSYKKLPA